MCGKNNCSCDIVLEFLEIFINKILYLREIYRKNYFRKRRIYNTPIHILSNIKVTDNYILNSLKCIRELKFKKALEKVEIVISNYDTKEIYETYVFEIDDYENLLKPRQIKNYFYHKNDQYLCKFEQELKNTFLQLERRIELLNKLPDDERITYRIHLHANEEAIKNLNNNPKFKNFQWVRKDETNEDAEDEISILPISKVQSTGVQFYVKKN